MTVSPPSSSLHVLTVVRQHFLADSLALILRRLPFDIHNHIANTLELVLASLTDKPHIILADPYAIRPPDRDLYQQQLANRPCDILLIALLPADTREYRDAAVQIGANGVVTPENAASELLAVLKPLLEKSNLMANAAQHFANSARESGPAGEPSFSGAANLESLGSQLVEQLAIQSGLSSDVLTGHIGATGQGTSDQPAHLKGFTQTASTACHPSNEQIFRTACNLNCGLHFCGLNVKVRSGRPIKITPAEFPDRRYRRLCLKGIGHLQTPAHPGRLRHPLKRSGPRGSGKWEAISWDQALDEIADQMRLVIDLYGSQSLLFFPYFGQISALNGVTGVYLRMASLLGASGTDLFKFGIDSAVPSGIQDTLGKNAGYLANDYADLHNSRLILIWGGDPVRSRMNWWSFFLEARRAGARLVVIDPKFSPTAAKADQWIPLRPGSDLYLALSMLHIIIENGWTNDEFVCQHTVAPLLVREDNGSYLHPASGDTSQYLVWDEQALAALPAGQAIQAALTGRYTVQGVTCRPAFSLLREMLEPYTPEIAAQHTGISVEQIIGLAKSYAQTRPARIFTLYGIDRWNHGAAFGRLITTLAALTGNLGIPGGGAGVDGFTESIMPLTSFYHPEEKHYLPINPAALPLQILEQQPYPIKAVMVAFNNWFNQWPDQNTLKNQVLPQLDLMVVADLFMTETARWADYVLPTASLFEREDLVKGPGPYIQYQPRIMPPPDDCRSDFEIASGLAKRLGIGNYFERSPDDYLAEILAELDPSLGQDAFAELKLTGVLRRKLPENYPVAFCDKQFQTPTGRVEFYVERLLPFGCALPDYESPIEAYPDNPLYERFPLIYITEHGRYRVHSTFVFTPWLREIDAHPQLLIHPVTAALRLIEDGDLVRVFNDRGFVVLHARLSQAVPPQAVYLSQGWQSNDYVEGHAQTLTHNLSNPANAMGPNVSFSDVLVEVIKAR